MYAGLRNVPFIGGLRDLLRRQAPTPRPSSTPVGIADPIGSAGGSSGGGTGDLGLISCARAALPTLRKNFGSLTMGGRAARPDNPTSDHPKGLAIDIMTTNPLVHARIVAVALTLPGFKYFCSDLIGGGASCPGNKHRDHVHISFHDRCS